MLKCWNHSTTTRNNAVTYYKTLEEVSWQLGLRKLKKWQTFSESLKIVKIIKLRVFSDRLFVSKHGGGGAPGGDAGGGGGVGWAIAGWGATAGWEVGAIVWGVNSGGVFNRYEPPSPHNYKSPKQWAETQLKGSKIIFYTHILNENFKNKILHFVNRKWLAQT